MLRAHNLAQGAFLALMICTSPLRGDLAREDLRTRNAASQAAIATIQLHAEVTIQYDLSQLPEDLKGSSPTARYTFDYSRSGNKERRQELSGSSMGVRDIIQDFDNKRGSMFTPKGDADNAPSVNSGFIAAAHRMPVLEPLGELVLFELPWCKKPLHRLLDQGQVNKIKSVTEGGRTLVYIDVRDEQDRHYEIWVDPSVNHLVRKFVAQWSLKDGTDARYEGEALSFQEVKPGVFFPDRLVNSTFRNGSWIAKVEASLTNLRVNEALPSKLFQHAFPPGTRVADEQRGISYFVGNRGQPTKTTPYQPAPPPAVIGTQTSLAAEAGWPWHRFVLLGSLIVVAVGLAMILWKRRRERAA